MAEAFTFARVLIAEAAEAFAFHTRISEGDRHIWPRNEADLLRYSKEGHLVCCRRSATHEIVGLCYSMLEGSCWEVGGLAVEPSTRGNGMGAVLVRFALVHTFVLQQPWRNGQSVIAHVHRENQSPRKILADAGFEFHHSIQIPGANAGSGMKLNADGNLVGDELEFTAGGLESLSAWLRDGFTGILPGGARATLDFGIYSIDDLRAALSEMVVNGTTPPPRVAT